MINYLTSKLVDKWDVTIVVLGVVLFVFTFFNNFLNEDYQHYTLLAESFLSGKLYFQHGEGLLDTVLVNGRYYFPLGPFPSVFLMPFVAIAKPLGIFFYQGYIQFFLVAGIFYFCFWIAKKLNYSRTDALYLALAFCFASVFHVIAIVPWYGFFAHVITVFLLFLTIIEYFSGKRFWLIGILFALVLMTRFTAGLGILFFVGDILLCETMSKRDKTKQLVIMLLPIIISGLMLLGYNYVRFGHYFDNGYSKANVHSMNETKRFEQINYGLFQLRNIPTNFYYYFIKTVDPVLVSHDSLQGNTYVLRPPYIKVGYPSVGFFIVSPIFLYIFKSRSKERVVKLSLLTSGVTLFVLLTYYWPGAIQTGPRYTLDFLPFMYIALLYSFQDLRLTRVAKLLIIGSAYLNLYLLLTLFVYNK